MAPVYYIMQDYYLPLRTGTIAADLLGWLLYIIYARINLIYREGFRLLAKVCYTLYLIYREEEYLSTKAINDNINKSCHKSVSKY